MEIVIKTDGDKRELEDFYHWLRSDVDVVRAGTVTANGVADTGRMGVFENVSMVLSNTTGLVSLAISFSSWRRARKKGSSSFTFEATDQLPPPAQEVVDQMNRPRTDDGEA